MSQVSIGRQIRELRRRKGWSLADLARRSGVSVSTIGRLERGAAHASRQTSIKPILEALTRPEREPNEETTRSEMAPDGAGVLADLLRFIASLESEERQRFITATIAVLEAQRAPRPPDARHDAPVRGGSADDRNGR